MFKVIDPEPIPKKPLEAKFPKLMVHKRNSNVICLFLSEKYSVIMSSYPVGDTDYYSSSEHFEDYNLPFTIQNILE